MTDKLSVLLAYHIINKNMDKAQFFADIYRARKRHPDCYPTEKQQLWIDIYYDRLPAAKKERERELCRA